MVERYIGFHVSIGKSLELVFERARELGCTTLQMFTRNPRGWSFRDLTKEQVQSFRKKRRETKFKYIVDHMPYLPNLASPDKEILRKSREALIQEVRRCEMLGIDFLVIHLGSHMGKGSELGIRNIADSCNEALSGRGKTVILLENSAGQKNRIGSSFEELSKLYNMISSKRIGICIDTCHLFAAGYDIRDDTSVKRTMKEFEQQINIEDVKVIHVNDSKGELGSGLDRHENLCKGNIGERGFKAFLGYDKIVGKLLILETPYNDDTTLKNDLKNLKKIVQSIDQKE